MYKLIKLVIKISSKMSELQIYNKIINDPIYRNRLYEIINEEL